MTERVRSKLSRSDVLGSVGLVATLPALFLVIGEHLDAYIRDIEAILLIAIHLILVLGCLFPLLLAALEFDTDGAVHFLRKVWDGAKKGVKKCVKTVPVRGFFGVVLKMLAVLNGVAALVAGVGLLIKLESASAGIRFELPSAIPLSFLPHDMNAIVLGVVVCWFWVATVLGYLGGDGWLASARRRTETAEPNKTKEA